MTPVTPDRPLMMHPILVNLAIDRARLYRLLGSALRGVGGRAVDRQQQRYLRRVERKEITSALYKNGEEMIRAVMRQARETHSIYFSDERQIEAVFTVHTSPENK